MGYIRTYKAQRGFRKSEVEVVVRSPEGKERTVLLGELEHIRPDRRKRRKHQYVTLGVLSKNPRIDLTYCLGTRQFSLTIKQGFHFGYVLLDSQSVAMLGGFIDAILYQSQKHSFGDYDKYDKYAKVAREWLGDQMKEKIKAARRAQWKTWKTRSRGRKPNGHFSTES